MKRLGALVLFTSVPGAAAGIIAGGVYQNADVGLWVAFIVFAAGVRVLL